MKILFALAFLFWKSAQGGWRFFQTWFLPPEYPPDPVPEATSGSSATRQTAAGYSLAPGALPEPEAESVEVPPPADDAPAHDGAETALRPSERPMFLADPVDDAESVKSLFRAPEGGGGPVARGSKWNDDETKAEEPTSLPAPIEGSPVREPDAPLA